MAGRDDSAKSQTRCPREFLSAGRSRRSFPNSYICLFIWHRRHRCRRRHFFERFSISLGAGFPGVKITEFILLRRRQNDRVAVAVGVRSERWRRRFRVIRPRRPSRIEARLLPVVFRSFLGVGPAVPPHGNGRRYFGARKIETEVDQSLRQG